MTQEERLQLLIEMRKDFRAQRPDLNLPPAGDEPVLAADAQAARERREAAQRKLAELKEQGRRNPRLIAKMIKRYTDAG